jgi:nitrogen regulatory protein PII 1
VVEIRAIIRREKVNAVKQELEKIGINGLTHWHVMGRGKQKGIELEGINYDELPKEIVYIVAEDKDKTNIVTIIINTAKTQPKGKAGDGRIFIVNLSEVYTISQQLV